MCNDYTMRGFCRTVGAWLIHFNIMKVPLAFQRGPGDPGRPGVYKAGLHWQRSPPGGAAFGQASSRRAPRQADRKRRAEGGGGGSDNEVHQVVRLASGGFLSAMSGASVRSYSKRRPASRGGLMTSPRQFKGSTAGKRSRAVGHPHRSPSQPAKVKRGQTSADRGAALSPQHERDGNPPPALIIKIESEAAMPAQAPV